MSRHHEPRITHNLILKALIIYDDFAIAAEANAMLQHTALEADAITHWNVRPWRVDTLRLPRRADEALAEAVDAHLIVFAGYRAQSFPSWLQDWLKQWVARRKIKGAGLAVVGGQSRHAFSLPAAPELSRFARRHGLSFIVDEGSGAEREAKFSTRIVPTDQMPPLAQSRFTDTATYSPYPHWGINE